MKYLTLLYADESALFEPGTPEFEADIAGFAAFDEHAGEAVLGGEALEPVATARTVRRAAGTAEGELVVSDGPFAESVEVLGGFYVLEAADLDEAIDLARRIPALGYGSIELRPMVEWFQAEGPPAGAGEGRFLLTIHGEEGPEEDPSSEGWASGAAEHAAFGAQAGPALLAAGAVHPSTTATTISLDGEALAVTDGPFSEAIEVVGGFYVLGGTAEQVLALAAQVPVPPGGGVEVRPVMELDG